MVRRCVIRAILNVKRELAAAVPTNVFAKDMPAAESFEECEKTRARRERTALHRARLPAPIDRAGGEPPVVEVPACVMAAQPDVVEIRSELEKRDSIMAAKAHMCALKQAEEERVAELEERARKIAIGYAIVRGERAAFVMSPGL